MSWCSKASVSSTLSNKPWLITRRNSILILCPMGNMMRFTDHNRDSTGNMMESSSTAFSRIRIMVHLACGSVLTKPVRTNMVLRAWCRSNITDKTSLLNNGPRSFQTWLCASTSMPATFWMAIGAQTLTYWHFIHDWDMFVASWARWMV